jgi:hypothetical protein
MNSHQSEKHFLKKDIITHFNFLLALTGQIHTDTKKLIHIPNKVIFIT